MGIGTSAPSSSGSDLYTGLSEPVPYGLGVNVEACTDSGEGVAICVKSRGDLKFGRGPALVRTAGEPTARDVTDDSRGADAEPCCDLVHEFARRVRDQDLVDLGGLDASLGLPGRPRGRRV